MEREQNIIYDQAEQPELYFRSWRDFWKFGGGMCTAMAGALTILDATLMEFTGRANIHEATPFQIGGALVIAAGAIIANSVRMTTDPDQLNLEFDRLPKGKFTEPIELKKKGLFSHLKLK